MKQGFFTGLLTLGVMGLTTLSVPGSAQASGTARCPADREGLALGFCYSNVGNENYLTLLQGAAAGNSFKVLFNESYIDGQLAAGLTSEAVFTLTEAFNGSAAKFKVDLTNTSAAPITASRVSILGFDVSLPLSSQTTVTDNNTVDENLADRDGVFTVVASGQTSQPQFLGSLDFCTKTGSSRNNCTGGGGDGARLGETLSFNPRLFFSDSGNAMFTNFYVRYQSIYGTLTSEGRVVQLTNASGIGIGLVPTPAFFLGLIGMGVATLRQKKQKAETSQETATAEVEQNSPHSPTSRQQVGVKARQS